MENLPGSAFIKDRDGRYVYVNRKFAEHWNRSKRELIGMTAHDLADEDLARAADAKDKSVLESNCAKEFLQTKPVSDDEDEYWLSVRFPIDEADGQQPVLGVVSMDVTTLRKMQEDLRRNQQRFEAFMDNIPGVAFMKDHQGRYLYVNRQLADVFGLTQEQMLGKTVAEVGYEELARQVEKDEKAVLAAGKPTEFLHTLNGTQGPQRWLNVRFPIVQADGEEPILGVVGLDVTERKRAEDALRESEERYRLLIESSGELILAVNAEGLLLLVNKAAAEAVGKAPSSSKARRSGTSSARKTPTC